MSNITTVTLTSGLGTGGTGTISTLDNLIGTAGTASAQVQTVQGIASMTALKVDPTAALDFGSGTSGTKTQRVILDSSQALSNGQATMTNSQPVVIASDQSTLPAAVASDGVTVGGGLVTPVFVPVAVSSSGVTNIVALTTSKKIRVLAATLTANGAVNVKWQSHVTPTDLTGLMYFAAAGDGIVLPFNPLGWFQTNSGEALDINLSGAVAVGGSLTYVVV